MPRSRVALAIDRYSADAAARTVGIGKEKKIRLPFEQRDVARLLGSLDRASLKGCRDYALILFLLDTGVRVGECATVRIEEVDWDEGRVLVHGKGQKQRYVRMGPTTSEALREYVAGFRGDDPGPLFLTREGRIRVARSD
jgi:site-specific recombinase XerD